MNKEINGWNRVYNHPDVIEYHKGNKKIELQTNIVKGQPYIVYSAGLNVIERYKTQKEAEKELYSLLLKY